MANIQKLFTLVLVILLATEPVNSVSFYYSDFDSKEPSLIFQGDSGVSPSGVLDLTDAANVETIGRVLYKTPIPLWDRATGNVASFITTFSFTMTDIHSRLPSDGIVFFLAPNTDLPSNSTGGYLAVVDPNKSSNEFVGVEFDSWQNDWDPNDSHFGIDVSTLKSLKYSNWNRESHVLVDVTIIYDSQSKILSVALEDKNGQFATVAQVVDLKAVLPEMVWVGFSAAGSGELHQIHSWSFHSTLRTTRTSSKHISSY